MSMTAPAVPLEVKSFDGEVVGSETLSLKVADPEVAKGLVHRYVVKVRRDLRQVKSSYCISDLQECRLFCRGVLIRRLGRKYEVVGENHFHRKAEVLQDVEVIDHR